MKRAKLSKRLLALLLTVLMTISMLPIYAEGVLQPEATGDVSEPALRVIVTAKINALAEGNFNSGLDAIIQSINNQVTGVVTNSIMALMTNDAIKDMAAPMMESAIQGILNQYGITLPPGTNIGSFIDDLMGNQMVDQLLNSSLIKDIIARTVQYAVADVMGDVALPTSAVVIAERRQELIDYYTTKIFAEPERPVDPVNPGGPKTKNALPTAGTTVATPNVNVSLYDFTVTAWNKILGRNISVKTIQVNGWHVGNIGTYIDLYLLDQQFDDVDAPNLSSINYEQVMIDALKKASKDVIREKIADLKEDIKEEIEAKIQAAIDRSDAHMVRKLNLIFEELDLDITITTEDTPEAIKAKIEQALQAINGENREAVRNALAAKCAALKLDIEIKYMPMIIAKVNNIVNGINTIVIIKKAEVAVDLTGDSNFVVPAMGQAPIIATYSTLGKYRYEYLKLLPMPAQWVWSPWTGDTKTLPTLTNTLTGSGGAIQGVVWNPNLKQVTINPAAQAGIFTLKSIYQHGIFKLQATESLTVTVRRDASVATRLAIVGEKDILVPKGDVANIEHYDVVVYDQYGQVMTGVPTELSADLHPGTYLDSSNDLHVSKTASHSYMYLRGTAGLQPTSRTVRQSLELETVYKVIYLHKTPAVSANDVINVINGLEVGLQIGTSSTQFMGSSGAVKLAADDPSIIWRDWYENWRPTFPGNQTVYVRCAGMPKGVSTVNGVRPYPEEFAPSVPVPLVFTVLTPMISYNQEIGRAHV